MVDGARLLAATISGSIDCEVTAIHGSDLEFSQILRCRGDILATDRQAATVRPFRVADVTPRCRAKCEEGVRQQMAAVTLGSAASLLASF